MTELNPAFLATLVFSGFRFILCIPDAEQDLTRLHPLKEPLPEIVATVLCGYVLPITEAEIVAMAEGIENYGFYIADNLFEGEN